MPAISIRPGVLVAGCLAVLPYLQTLRFGFVNYDDPGHVAENPVERAGLTPFGLAWACGLGVPVPDARWYNCPLTWLSHMADGSLFGSLAGGHHLASVAPHAVNAALVVPFIRSLGATAAATVLTWAALGGLALLGKPMAVALRADDPDARLNLAKLLDSRAEATPGAARVDDAESGHQNDPAPP